SFAASACSAGSIASASHWFSSRHRLSRLAGSASAAAILRLKPSVAMRYVERPSGAESQDYRRRDGRAAVTQPPLFRRGGRGLARSLLGRERPDRLPVASLGRRRARRLALVFLAFLVARHDHGDRDAARLSLPGRVALDE